MMSDRMFVPLVLVLTLYELGFWYAAFTMDGLFGWVSGAFAVFMLPWVTVFWSVLIWPDPLVAPSWVRMLMRFVSWVILKIDSDYFGDQRLERTG